MTEADKDTLVEEITIRVEARIEAMIMIDKKAAMVVAEEAVAEVALHVEIVVAAEAALVVLLQYTRVLEAEIRSSYCQTTLNSVLGTCRPWFTSIRLNSVLKL